MKTTQGNIFLFLLVAFFLVVAFLKVDVWEPILTDLTAQMAYAINHTEPGQK